MKDLGHEALAELLGTLADFELEHFRALERSSAGMALPPVAPPKFSRGDAAQLLTPRQVLAVALEGENRAYAFYEKIVMSAPDAAVREVARELALEEAEHIALIERLLDDARG